MIPLHDSVPTRRRPVLTIALIVANLAVFVWSQNASTQILLSNHGLVPVDGFTAVTAEYGFVPCELTMRKGIETRRMPVLIWMQKCRCGPLE